MLLGQVVLVCHFPHLCSAMDFLNTPKACIAMIMVGCCVNVWSLEAIVRQDPGSGNLITAVQFLFVTIAGVRGELRNNSWKLKKRAIPLWVYSLQVAIFWSLSFLNAKAFDFQITPILHLIFRSGSLVFNMLCGFVLFGKTYSLREMLCVVGLTFGIALASFGSSQTKDRVSTRLCFFAKYTDYKKPA